MCGTACTRFSPSTPTRIEDGTTTANISPRAGVIHPDLLIDETSAPHEAEMVDAVEEIEDRVRIIFYPIPAVNRCTKNMYVKKAHK